MANAREKYRLTGEKSRKSTEGKCCFTFKYSFDLTSPLALLLTTAMDERVVLNSGRQTFSNMLFNYSIFTVMQPAAIQCCSHAV